MFSLKKIRSSLFAALWIAVLTLPLMVIRVNTVQDVVEWRWLNLGLVFIGTFVVAMIWTNLLERKERAGVDSSDNSSPSESDDNAEGIGFGAKIGVFLGRVRAFFKSKKIAIPLAVLGAVVLVAYPFMTSLYQTGIVVRALIYVVLGLGLNIVVGLGGMLNLGYVAFFAVGAYSYGLLNMHLDVGFWVALPVGGAMAAVAGLILAFPILRLRGDYLAIVTLAFGEIVRLVLVNWVDFSRGPMGIANIPRPSLFGLDLNLSGAMNYLYFIVLALTVLTIFVIMRLENSRIGRALVAMREDEIACESMGIDIAKTKLMAFAVGATWAGFAGVVFAGYTTFINPSSFNVWESVIVLCIVVLGGMGSIKGIVVAGLAMILLPEYLRPFAQYRLLIFGALLVIMMVFKPAGLIPARRRKYTIQVENQHGEST